MPMLLYGNQDDMNGVDIYADLKPQKYQGSKRYAPIWSRFESMATPSAMPTPLIPHVDRNDYCKKLEELNKVIDSLHSKRKRYNLCCFHYKPLRAAQQTLELETKRIFKPWRRLGIDVYLLPGSVRMMKKRYKAVTDLPNRLRISIPEPDEEFESPGKRQSLSHSSPGPSPARRSLRRSR
jgi:hypothetical protein